MKKKSRKLSLHRETLRDLVPATLSAARGGDNKPPFTVTQLPSERNCDTFLDCTNTCACDP